MEMLIKDLPESGVITDPGAYRVDMAAYHTQEICDGVSMSSSGLREIHTKSPFHYYSTSPFNPKRFPRVDTDPMMFGRAAHALILGDEVFADHYKVRPIEFNSYKSADAKQWKSDVIATGYTPLTPEDVIHIGYMSESLSRMELIDLLMEGHQEVSHFWKDAKTGIWLKSRLDQTSTGGDLIDLKVTFDASDRGVDRVMAQRGYPMQGALAYEASENSWGYTPPGLFFAFVEPKPPYLVNIMPVDDDAIHLARFRNRKAIDTFYELSLIHI